MNGFGWGCAIAGAGAVGGAILLWLGSGANRATRFWLTAVLFSLCNLIGVFVLWTGPINNHLEQLPEDLIVGNREEVAGFLTADLPSSEGPFVEIPTGIHLNVIRFWQSNTVHIAGLVWQRLPDPLPPDVEPGIQWLGATNIRITEAPRPRQVQGKTGQRYVVKAWNFEQDLRQAFHYHTFPFDSHIVWLACDPGHSREMCFSCLILTVTTTPRTAAPSASIAQPGRVQAILTWFRRVGKSKELIFRCPDPMWRTGPARGPEHAVRDEILRPPGSVPHQSHDGLRPTAGFPGRDTLCRAVDHHRGRGRSQKEQAVFIYAVCHRFVAAVHRVICRDTAARALESHGSYLRGIPVFGKLSLMSMVVS